MKPTDQTNDAEIASNPSKTQLKAKMHALQELGEALVALNKERLAELQLPELLYDAVKETQRTTAHGALRRQLQYLGRIMREIDTTTIEEKLAKWNGTRQEENAIFHQLERLRTKLLEDDNSLAEYINTHPEADVQQLRTLIRNARKEAEAGKPPKSSRELFKILRELSGN